MTSSSTGDKVQALLDEFEAQGVAPGFAAAYVSSDYTSPVFTAGVRDLETKAPLHKDDIYAIFSASKLVTSCATLKALEQGMIPGMDLQSLDDADALVKYLPELAVGSDNTFMSIFEGWEDKEARKMRLRPAEKPVTLRHLLTFTAGSRGDFDDEDVAAFTSAGESAPAPFDASATNTNQSLGQPRHAESGQEDAFGYGGPSGDWTGILLTRALGKTQRQIMRELVADPLEMSQADYDYIMTDETRKHKLPIWFKGQDGFSQMPWSGPMETWVDGPDSEHQERSQSAFSGTVGGYIKLLQAVLNRSPKLLSPKGWEIAFKDDLAHRSVKTKVPQPLLKGKANPSVSGPVHLENEDVGISLLQAMRENSVSASTGLSAGTLWWAGLANFHWFIDPAQGIAAVIATQVFPFYEPKIVDAVTRFKRLMVEERKAGSM